MNACQHPEAELKRVAHASWSRPKTANPTSPISLAGRWAIAVVALSAAKPPFKNGLGRRLRVEVDRERMNFAYRVEGVDNEWRWLPQQFDASILSDECIAPGQAHFTGAFVGMACQDMSGTGKAADFDFFEYQERSFRVKPSYASAKEGGKRLGRRESP